MEGGLVVGGADESMKGRDDEVVPGETGRRRGGASGGAGALTEAETRVPTATRLTIYDSRPTTHDPQLTIHHPASEASGPSSILHPPSILFYLEGDLLSVGSKSPPWRGHVLDSDPGRDRVGRGAKISTVAAVFSDGFSRFDRPKKGVKKAGPRGSAEAQYRCLRQSEGRQRTTECEPSAPHSRFWS
jgi:hypothetical protein